MLKSHFVMMVRRAFFFFEARQFGKYSMKICSFLCVSMLMLSFIQFSAENFSDQNMRDRWLKVPEHRCMLYEIKWEQNIKTKIKYRHTVCSKCTQSNIQMEEHTNGQAKEQTNERMNRNFHTFNIHNRFHTHISTHTRIDVCISVRLLAQATISEIRNHNKLGLCH